MEADTKLNGDITIFTPSGRIDTMSARDFEKEVNGLIGKGCKKLIIVFADIDYISSAGLRVLLLAGKRLKVSRGNIALSDMADRIFEVFKISGFDKILTIFNTIEEAKNFLG